MKIIQWQKLPAGYSISTQLTIIYVVVRGTVQNIRSRNITIEQGEYFVFNIETYEYCQEKLQDSVLAEICAYGMELENIVKLVPDRKAFDSACTEILKMLNEYHPVNIDRQIPIVRFFSGIESDLQYCFLLLVVQGLWCAYREGRISIITCRNLLADAAKACDDNSWTVLSEIIRFIENHSIHQDVNSSIEIDHVDSIITNLNCTTRAVC